MSSRLIRAAGGSGPQNPLYITPTTYFFFDGVNTLYLYVNSTVAQTWTEAAPTSGTLTGQPYGLLLALTQP